MLRQYSFFIVAALPAALPAAFLCFLPRCLPRGGVAWRVACRVVALPAASGRPSVPSWLVVPTRNSQKTSLFREFSTCLELQKERVVSTKTCKYWFSGLGAGTTRYYAKFGARSPKRELRSYHASLAGDKTSWPCASARLVQNDPPPGPWITKNKPPPIPRPPISTHPGTNSPS